MYQKRINNNDERKSNDLRYNYSEGRRGGGCDGC